MKTADRSPPEERAFQIHYARVLLREASRRRHFGNMWFWLMERAANARRTAASIDISPAQADLFG